MCDWKWRLLMIVIHQDLLAETKSIFNTVCCKKNIWKMIHVNIGVKTCWIFVPGYFLFLEAHSFPRAMLLENHSLLGKYNDCGQISDHFFSWNAHYCLHTVWWKNHEKDKRSPGIQDCLINAKLHWSCQPVGYLPGFLLCTQTLSIHVQCWITCTARMQKNI